MNSLSITAAGSIKVHTFAKTSKEFTLIIRSVNSQKRE